MKLLIVIVNYRSAGLTAACLRSLAPEIAANPGARVVIADNLSPDDSVAQLTSVITQNNWSGWAEVRP